MTEENESEFEPGQSKLLEMAIRGKEFRDEFEIELYGEPVTAVIRPLVDDEFLPIMGFLADHFDVDFEDREDLEDGSKTEEVMDQARDQVDEAEVDGQIDPSQMDDEFVDILQTAAVLGLEGALDVEGEYVDHNREEAEQIVSSLMGGHSIELGFKILEISGDVDDATKFRGTRGSL